MDRRTLLLIIVAAALAGCLGTSRSAGSGPSLAERSSTSRIAIPVAQMSTPPSLLTLLEMRVRNMAVKHTAGCPEIEFRGRNSMVMTTSPSVYVDGQRASNTCVLELLSPVDVNRLEIYPSGVANRPGYFSNAGGLILVFKKDGS